MTVDIELDGVGRQGLLERLPYKRLDGHLVIACVVLAPHPFLGDRWREGKA
jgi:hypothetical protein